MTQQEHGSVAMGDSKDNFVFAPNGRDEFLKDSPLVAFSSADGWLGKLFEADGSLHFEGNATDAAKLFFDEVIRLYSTALSRPVQEPVAVPDGWKLVPIKPTDDMLDSALGVHEVRDGEDEEFFAEFRRTYRAMLSAAPQPTHGTSATDPAPSVKALAPVTAGQGVEVKPLEWIGDVFSSEAKTIVGNYRVDRFAEKARFYSLDSSSYQWFDTVEAAKNAAQNDYEKRILSAISPLTDTPAQAGNSLALEKAIDFIESLTREPLLMGLDDIEMTLDDVQDHARIELASIRKVLATPTPKEESK